MRLTIPDDVAEVYEGYARAQGKTTDELMVAQLTRFSAYEPGKKAIVLTPAVHDALIECLFGTPLKDGADLLKRVQSLAGLSFHHLRLTLSEQQLHELQTRSERQGKDVKVLLAEMAQLVLRDLFWVNGSGVATTPTVEEIARPPVKKAG